MKHLCYWSLAIFAIALLLLSARACGPDFPTAVFILPQNPDSYKVFVKGDLELLQPGFHTRHLVVAYRYLSGKPLSSEEQKSATAVNDFFLSNGSSLDKPAKETADNGLTLWTDARKLIDLKDADFPYPKEGLETERHLPGQDYETFENCLNAAFLTAADTLNAHKQQHGAKDPAVLDWVLGQDAVFSNCGDGQARGYHSSSEKLPVLAQPHLPVAAPANAPLWLKQDRAYQFAAADFYAMDFDAAIAGFRAIAADTTSPWSVTARYLVARAYLRKASLSPELAVNGKSTEESKAAAMKDYAASLVLAQKELLAMRAEPRMKSLHNAIDDLLDYVDIRLDPQAQSIALAHRFLTPNSPRFRQSLVDFTVIHTTSDEGNSIPAITAPTGAAPTDQAAPTASPDKAASDLVDWVEALNAKDRKTALSNWKASHSNVWLAAALMLTKKPDASTPALLAAAKTLPNADPAYLTVTYHRLRLSMNEPATRSEIMTLLPQVRKSDGTSAINEFIQLAAESSPSLEAWLQTAPRTPAGENSDFDLEVDKVTLPTEDVCGRKTTTYSLFDTDAAVTFNQLMPLRILAAAAESTRLPANLRFQVAQATWARAVLLDKPEIAQRMTPLLVGCRATWKPVLAVYDASKTPSDRHANGLLALMRFASTEPSVRDGEERRSGFATFDEFRQNWWCSTIPLPTETVDEAPMLWRPNADPDAVKGSDPATITTHPHVAPPPPPFLTASDLAEAKTEVAALRAVPNSSTYFAQQALAWMQQYPSDPRTPDILGYANRALRSTCRNDPAYNVKPGPLNTAALAHALFDALHQHYPNSAWTKRYSTWE